MERGSTKHGPELDEQMKRETRGFVQGSNAESSRVEEHRMTEDPGSAQPVAEGAPVQDGVLTQPEIEQRSAIARALDGSIFPATRDEIVRAAEERMTPPEVLAMLHRLPDGEYENVQRVWEGLGGEREERF